MFQHGNLVQYVFLSIVILVSLDFKCYAQAEKNIFNKGLEYAESENYDAAITQFNKLLAINPRLDRALYNRGLAYFKKGDLDQAISDYTHAIEINPSNDKAYYNRGIAFDDQGKLDQAIADYETIRTVSLQHVENYQDRSP